MSTAIAPEDVRVGDVLLYRPTGWIGRMICLFDGGDYSHAAIYTGERVLEAIGSGIAARDLGDSVGSGEVDVFRFLSDEGKRLGEAGCPVEPLVARMNHYIANHERYGYEQILLLAALTSTRRLPVVGWIPGLSRIVRTIVDAAAAEIANLLAEGREPMICSELVYRCYAEAGQEYRLRIAGAELKEAGPASDTTAAGTDPSAERDLQEARLAIAEYGESYRAARAAAVSSDAEANFVTPRDLQHSPNLYKAGALKRP